MSNHSQLDQNKYSTQEREASQAFSTGERSESQKYGTQEREASQEFSTGERLSSQEYGTQERLSSQEYNTGEREASELFQAREASKARAQNFMTNKMLEAAQNKFSADKDYTGGASNFGARSYSSGAGRMRFNHTDYGFRV